MGASDAVATEIFAAIRHREYSGVDIGPETSAAPVQPPVAVVAPVQAPPVQAPVTLVASVQAPPVQAPAIVEPVQAPVAVRATPTPAQHGLTLTSASGPDMLTDSEVTSAILQSRLNGRHRIGLMLNDQQTAWGSILVSALANASCTYCPAGGVSGSTIFVYSPEQWIEQMAVNARREMLPFTADNVTPEMRVKMLHVVAMPSTPEYLNGTGFALSSSVHRIVITDTSRNEIVQPVQLANGSVTTNSALRSAEFSTASAAFKMTEVERLRALDGKSEFFITVTGSNQVKFFKVKEKFFKSLFN